MVAILSPSINRLASVEGRQKPDQTLNARREAAIFGGSPLRFIQWLDTQTGAGRQHDAAARTAK